MKILILGGTQFIGRHVVECVHGAGHAVSVLNRGRSPDELPESVERLHGDRDGGLPGLSALRDRTWDMCVDVSGYTPRQVRPSVATLHERVGRYVFVSAVRVYGDPRDRPVRETHPRVSPASEDVTEITDETYGPLKVACEDIVQQAFGERSTILRPQVVAGPHDPIDRLSYWVRRAAAGGAMLAPGDGSDHLQFIDARDAGRFVRTVVERDLSGVFNLAGARLPWAVFMTLLGARDLVWIDATILGSAGLAIGELPLYRPERGPRSGLMDICSERARGAGLTLTDPAVTIRDTRAWLATRDRAPTVSPALSPEREAELIAAARRAARGAG